jgi:E3 ubiquitin-protein ligase SHPRH
MLERTVSNLLSEERKLLLNSMNQCHVKEQLKEFISAIEKYEQNLITVRKKLNESDLECQHFLEHQTVLSNGADDEEEEEERLSQIKLRMKTWKELEHRLIFFIASAYHNIGNDQNLADDSNIRALENQYYEDAADIRSEMLKEFQDGVVKSSSVLSKEMLKTNEIIEKNISEPLQVFGGLVANVIFEDSIHIVEQLEDQLELLVDYRDNLYKILVSSLEGGDIEEGNPSGEEYEKGIVDQDNAMIYQDEMRYLLVQRKRMLGIETSYPDSIPDVLNGTLQKELKKKRINYSSVLGSLKNSAQRLRKIVNEYQRDSPDIPNYLPEMEYVLIMDVIPKINKIIEQGNKITVALEREMGFVSDLFNERVKYFSQLNKLSDGVVMPEWLEDLDQVQTRLVKEQGLIQSEIVKILGRKRYFEYLQKENCNTDTVRQCGSCHTDFERGVLTACGHWFCADCTKTWIAVRKRCPMCNQAIITDGLVHVSFKKRRTYPQHQENIEHLKLIKIQGSHGTKFDSIIKHIISLIRVESTIKVLCFSQWKVVLDIFAVALEQNGIGYIALEGKGWDPVTKKRLNLKKQGQSVLEFTNKPQMNVFMLNAKSQSSGLTLVCATHVFLIEPVVQKGLELQAINRVHRIGQEKETFVWRYLIEDSVEELLVSLANDQTIGQFIAPTVQAKDRGESIHQDTLCQVFKLIHHSE